MKEMVENYNHNDGDLLKKLNMYMETVQKSSDKREKKQEDNWYA